MKQSCKQNSDSEVTEKCRQTHVRMDIPSQGTQGWRGRMYIHEYEKRRKQTKKQRGRERERAPTTCYLLVKTRQHHMLLLHFHQREICSISITSGTSGHQRHEDQAGITHSDTAGNSACLISGITAKTNNRDVRLTDAAFHLRGR